MESATTSPDSPVRCLARTSPEFSEPFGIHATIGGRALIRGRDDGSNLCASGVSIAVSADNAIIESTQRKDSRATDSANTLWGRQNDDELLGMGGADILEGEAGEDTIHGGDGNDIVRGETSNDILYDEADKDRLYGGSGRDHIHAQGGFEDLITVETISKTM